MVFGWKKKQQSTASVPVPIHRSIALCDIEPTLEELVKQRRQTIITEYQRSLPQVRQRLAEMLKITHTLESQTLTEDETDKHISTIVERGKNQVITVIKKAAGNDIPDVGKYDELADTNREIHRILKIIGDVLGRQTRVIHIFAKKYAIQLKHILSELNNIRDELTTSLHEHESFEDAITRLYKKISHLDSLYATVRTTTSKISDMTQQIKNHKEICESTSKKITEISSSDEYVAYTEILCAIEKLDVSRGTLAHKIDESFARISRPLSKYIYVSSLEKATKNTMRTMLNSPSSALFATDSAQISVILEHIRKAVTSGSISVKDISKSQEQIDAVISEIDGIYLQMTEHTKKRAELDSKLHAFDSSTLDTENATLKNSQEKLVLLESAINEIRAESDAATLDIPSILQNIETELRKVTNITYTISKET